MPVSNRSLKHLLCFTLVTLAGLLCSRNAHAISVDTVADTPALNPACGTCADANGDCSLRAAIQSANMCALPQVIDLLSLAPGAVIELTHTGAGEDAGATGDLDVLVDLTITGNLASPPIIDGIYADRIFDVPMGHDLVIEFMELHNGLAPVGAGELGGCIREEGGSLTLYHVLAFGCESSLSGGAISVRAGEVWIFASEVRASVAGVVGGALYAEDSSAFLDGSQIAGNQAALHGGGLLVARSSSNVPVSLMVAGSTILSGNVAGLPQSGVGDGGALWTNVPTDFKNSVAKNNTANGYGGGLFVSGQAEIQRSSLSSNIAVRSGGGLICHSSACALQLRNTTIAFNEARNGGGLAVGPASGAGLNNVTVAANFAQLRGGNLFASNTSSVEVSNSIIAKGSAPTGLNCYGTLVATDHTLIEDASACTLGSGSNNILGISAGLAAFGQYCTTNVTSSWSLGPSSPALDTASWTGAAPIDQCSTFRPVNAQDMGALEN